MFSLARMPWWRRWFGTRSERAASRYLRQQGMRILAWNVTSPVGEIDIVALDGRCIVFIEVRSTSSSDISRPAESVDERKQRRLTACALHYLGKRGLLECAARFDVLAIAWPASRREPEIVHYRHAFEAIGRGQMFS